MKNEEITQQILEAWDEVEGVTADEPEEEEQQGEEQETPDEVGEEESVEEGDEEVSEEDAGAEEPDVGEGEGEEEEEEPEVHAEQEYEFLSDEEAQAWYARYGNDPERALKGAWQLEKVLGRQGQEKAVLTRKVRELESALAEITAFQSEPTILSSEQQQWVVEALESGNPAAYVREASKAGEFNLARVICTEWGREDPYNALRTAQIIDQAEQRRYAAAQQEVAAEPVNHAAMMEVLVQHFPDMPQYEAKMVEIMQRLGDDHHRVVEARSQDPETAAAGILYLYDMARESSANVAQAKQELRRGTKEQSATARKKAVVASGASSPAAGEAPRSIRIGPGLTMAQLDEEWERNR